MHIDPDIIGSKMVKYLFEEGEVQIEGYVPPSQP